MLRAECRTLPYFIKLGPSFVNLALRSQARDHDYHSEASTMVAFLIGRGSKDVCGALH